MTKAFNILGGLLIIGTLTNCGPAMVSQSGTAAADGALLQAQSIASGDVLFDQNYNDKLDHVLVVSNQAPPAGQTPCTVNELCLQLGVPVPAGVNAYTPITWNVGDFTGFYPTDPAAAQRGPYNDWYGSTAVQSEFGVIGIHIHSDSLKSSGQSIFPTAVYHNWTLDRAPKPFAQNKTLVYSIDLKVPTAYATEPTAFAYITGYFRFHDAVSGKEFWYGTTMYDHRGGDPRDSLAIDAWEGGSQDAIIGTRIGVSGRYATTIDNSAGYQTATWSDFKTFAFAVTPENFRNAIADMRRQQPTIYANLSTDIATYQITSVNYNPEVAYQGGFARIGSAFKNLRISVRGNARDQISQYYREILNREPEAKGLNAWVESANRGASLTEIRRGIAASEEAHQRVRDIYKQVLGRDVEPFGLANADAQLSSGMTLGRFRATIAFSDEAAQGLRAVALANGRRPDDVTAVRARTWWADLLLGASLNDVRSQIR